MKSRVNKDKDVEAVAQQANIVIDGLKKVYFNTVKPMEEQFLFHEFHSSPLGVGDFDAKPSVLLIGQYSTGKTSFIRYILGRDFPGARIGPEPTTDRFMAIQYGDQERVIPGNTAAAQTDRPWTGLQKFGVEFLNRFECSETPSPVLQELTFIDSPGILSGEKQRIQRGYDFVKVARWFAERADKILLLFDAHKLDISDEFKRTIEGIAFAHNKISVVLNKADMIGYQELMRVYGALMWSLGKIVQTPEVARVYVSSFWENAKTEHVFLPLFKQERSDLLKDLRLLPKQSTLSKVNEVVKRCRILKVHMCIIGYLRDQMPAFFGKGNKTKELIDNLDQVFVEVQRKHQLAVGDFPDLTIFREKLQDFDMSKFKKMNMTKMNQLEAILSIEIPKLVEIISIEAVGKTANPFDDAEAGLTGVIDDMHDWAIAAEIIARAKEVFPTLNPNEQGRAHGGVVKTELEKSGLDVATLRLIWNLSSIDGKGSLDVEEFTVALHLTEIVKSGKPLPQSLPLPLVPPSKRASPIYA